MNTLTTQPLASTQPSKGYVLAIVQITQPEKYADYRLASAAVASKFGGTAIIRGGEPAWLEGAVRSERVVLIEFPSRDLAQAYASSPEYRDARKLREGAADVIFAVLSGA
jgi:uncharacterized protein (DUF1330 family)